MQAHISVKARFADEYERPQLRRGRHTPFPRRVSAQAKVRIMFRAGLVDIRHNARDRRVPATCVKFRECRETRRGKACMFFRRVSARSQSQNNVPRRTRRPVSPHVPRSFRCLRFQDSIHCFLRPLLLFPAWNRHHRHLEHQDRFLFGW